MEYTFPYSIKNDFQGYDFLIRFYNDTKSCKIENITLDLKRTRWFEGNIVAILGAIIDNLKGNFNKINIVNLSPRMRTLFERNHFLHVFDGDIREDNLHTTIEYRKFKKEDEKSFREYVDVGLLAKSEMPRMSPLLRKKISENIFEIFYNAIIHGNCQNIYSCGQYYPTKSRLDFTIVDLGVTIRKNVNKFLGKKLSSKESIIWAVEVGNTTKVGAIPGGLGLGLIREFLQLNDGKIQIVSAKGYWEQKIKEISAEKFSCNFPGTIVNLEFNLRDKKEYYLSSEIDKDDIF